VAEDGDGLTGVDSIVIEVTKSVNSQPVASAGLDTAIPPGGDLRMDGTGSFDPDGDSLLYYWTIKAQPLGSQASIRDPETPQPEFTGDLEGEYEIELVVFDAEIGSVSDTIVVTVRADACPPLAPRDVRDGHWAFPDICAIYNAGITVGCSLAPPLYCPNGDVTRAEMATFIVRAMGEEGNLPSYQGYFGDVSAGQWYTGYVERLYELGITTGCSGVPLLYCPTGLITRAEMAAFVIRALGEEGNLPSYQGYFADVPVGMWYTAHVERLYQLGVTIGFPDGTYRPEDPVGRDEMAAYMQRAWDLATPATVAADEGQSPLEGLPVMGGFGAMMAGVATAGWLTRRRWRP
jgi:hypothetical protein